MAHLCRLVGMTQEHGQVEATDGPLDFESFPVGSILALIPYHVSIHHTSPTPTTPRHTWLSILTHHRPVPLLPCTLSTTSMPRGRWWNSGTQSVAGREQLLGCCTSPRTYTHTGILCPYQDLASVLRSCTRMEILQCMLRPCTHDETLCQY